jgi:hypothetical protein
MRYARSYLQGASVLRSLIEKHGINRRKNERGEYKKRKNSFVGNLLVLG